MKGSSGFLSVEDAVRLKFNFSSPDDQNFSCHQLEESCICGAPMLCACFWIDDFVYEVVKGRHFCLNEACHHSQDGSREMFKSTKRQYSVDQCPVCFRGLKK